MRSVMIVDDEALVRIGLQSIIDWESRGYAVEGVFKSGEEALAAARQRVFDIVLTDIRMPGMDGFELIRRLKQLDPRSKFIVLSSYNDFEYTRQAIRLGVADYISKYEMEPAELLRVLDGLQFDDGGPGTERIFGDRSPGAPGVPRVPGAGTAAGTAGGAGAVSAAESAARLADRKRQLLDRTAEEESGYAEAELTRLLEELTERRGDAVRWLCLRPLPREAAYSPAERKAMALQTEEIFSRMTQLEYLGEHGGSLHGLYLTVSGGEAAVRLKELQRETEELRAAWAKNLNVELIAGISPAGPPAAAPRLRREAETAAGMAFYAGADIYPYEAYRPAIWTEEQWTEWYRDVKIKLQLLQFDELGDELAGAVASSGERLLLPSEWLRLGQMVAAQLLDVLLERYDLGMDKLRARFGTLWPLEDAVARSASAAEFAGVMKRALTVGRDTIAELRPSRGWVQTVKDYVERCYGQPIRLEEMADRVGFSPNHFSVRFRQETGEAFTDYLTRVRIGEAIRLYRETDDSTEEIAATVGYTNPNYFIKVFKKVTGKTIKEFKRRQ